MDRRKGEAKWLVCKELLNKEQGERIPHRFTARPITDLNLPEQVGCQPNVSLFYSSFVVNYVPESCLFLHSTILQ